MKNCILVLLSTSLLVNCKTLKPADLIVAEPKPLTLPALQGEVDIDNLFTSISYGDTILTGTVEITRMTPSRVLVELDTQKIFIPEERVYDIIKLFASEINNNINDTDTIKHGVIKLELLSFKEKRNPLMMFFSVWTLCIPSLVGVPITSIRTNLEI